MRIKKAIEKVPGGMMLVPMLVSATINTFAPEVFQIGGFVSEIMNHHNTFIGGFLVCMGAGMTLKSAPKALKIGAVVTVSKFVFAVVLGLLVEHIFGSAGFYGLSSLAVIAAVSNTNGGLYAALTSEFGSNEEIGAISVISINDGPFLTMIAVGAAGIATIPFMDLVAVVIPIIVGMILGNLDPDMREFLTRGGDIMVPFMGLALGTRINFGMILTAGPLGVVLGIVTVLVGGALNIFADRVTGGTGVAGAACSSTAGNAVGVPLAVAVVDPTLSEVAAIATPFVAASTVVTAILTPILTTWVYKRNLVKHPDWLSEKDRKIKEMKGATA
ncbi:MAG: 2-keto-3-deoxygluconate permease [Synergistaceae bacterium]|nr:2-keto-3-deoxygluconate permease [Synergistaceae bacterium]